MKKTSKLISLLVALCMILSLGAFASGDPSGDASAENAADVLSVPTTSASSDTADMTASEYAYLTNYTNRDDTGNVFVGNDVTTSGEMIALDETVTGAGYTAVYAHGADASVTVTGTLVATDETSGEMASDFSGQGAIIVGYDGATVNVEDATIYTDGFERSALIVSQNAVITAKDSTFVVLGANPLTEAYDTYVNSANQNIMLSPPWVLGIQGGGRFVNMIGETPTLTLINCDVVAGGWALISTDSGSNMVINVVDTEMSILPESEGGMDSGWRIFGYDEDAYGSGYGAYYIGNPSQYYYGTVMNGVTYAAIITGANCGHYASSNGSIDLYDANGNLIETVEGEGAPTVINGVFGFMSHNSVNDGIYVEDGTIVNTEDATVIYKAANSQWYFDDAELNSAKGVIFQMIDNDDDSRVGMISMAEGFSKTYDESNVNAGDGFPGVNYDYTSTTGGNTVTASYTNGEYNGDIFNGTGYYGQTGDNLYVTLGEGAVLTGDIALTSTIKGIPYSAEAVEGIAYYGDNIGYIFLDAQGNVCDEADAAYIQIQSYTMNEYFMQGHVENMNHYNGASTIDVVVAAGAVWNVEGESLITSLTIEAGAEVYGELTENADGTLTITASDKTVAAGSYGSISAIGGGTTIGGGIDASGELNVEAAAGAMADQQTSTSASGEASSMAAVEGALVATSLSAETADESADTFEVTIRVNGTDYKTANIGASVDGNVYTFQISELLNALGITLTYDEDTAVASVGADSTELLDALMGQFATEADASAEPAEEAAAAEEEAVPATDGTENQSNTIAGDAQPATEEEFDAYVAYLTDYVTNYTGSADGTFDDGARAMALGELTGVAFGADVNAFPFEMYVTQFGAMDYAAFAGDSSASGELASGDTSDAAYQTYLKAFVASCEDIQTSGAAGDFDALIDAGDYVSFPAEMLFDATWFGEAAMTYDEFVAAGGVYEIAEHVSNGAMLDGETA